MSTSIVVYLSIPTSNHNRFGLVLKERIVVYLSIPTSNHNSQPMVTAAMALFICLFLHQTTTMSRIQNEVQVLFICLFLHQTTTGAIHLNYLRCCLSVYSYIKPQLILCTVVIGTVVYLSIPTSNHNLLKVSAIQNVLFICLFLHQTTTIGATRRSYQELFICLFLHQTTT